jgi:hypothetical protein
MSAMRSGILLCLLLCLTGCSLHYRRADFRWPATSGPSDLRLRLHPLAVQVKVGEPILVTASLVNVGDTLAVVHLQDIDGGMRLELVNSSSDTWFYRIRDWEGSIFLDPEAFYGIEPGDSLYWRYLLWPQRFYRHNGNMPGVGPYQLTGRFTLILYGRDNHDRATHFTLCDTAGIALTADTALTNRLRPCSPFLDMWFHNFGFYVAADSALAHCMELQRATDSAFPYLDYLLTEIARAGHDKEALDLAIRFLARYPNHPLAEELRSVLPYMYGACGEEEKEDSLAADFVATYPRNAAALRLEPGRSQWRERCAIPSTQRRVRKLFMGIPGPWGPWHDWHSPPRPRK